MTEKTNDLPLHPHPDHLADLRKSGLSDNTIKDAKSYSVPPRDISKIFNHPKVESMLAFPYPGTDHVRYKLFSSEPILDKDGHEIKYYQPKGSSNRLYIPERVRLILSDPSIPLHITEGEKKTWKMNQEGPYCIGLGGLWGWSDGSEEKNLIADFNLFEWKGREVYLDPDNDFLKPDRHGDKKNTGQAVKELGYRLIDRGAKPFVTYLPEGTEKGVDDYLCNHSVDEFNALPKREVRKPTIEKMIEEASIDNLPDILKRIEPLKETEKEIYIRWLSEKLDIPKKAIRTDLQRIQGRKSEKDKDGEAIEKLLESESERQSFFSAQEIVDGQLVYGGIFGKKKVLLRSDGEIILPQEGIVFRFTRSNLTTTIVKRFKTGDVVNGKDLIDRLTGLFSSHLIFKDKKIPLLLGVWTMGTYFFQIFRFYGYLWIKSALKRCGKSLLLDILSLMCFNASPLMTDPTEAYIFREVDGNSTTLIIDEAESLGEKDREKNPAMISLFNVGFKRGSVVPRMEARGKEFVVVYYSAYSPKVFAGVKDVVDTIEDRSLKITMIRKLRSEKVARLNLRKQEHEIEILKEDLYLWALKEAEAVMEVYDASSDGFKEIESIDDRQKDILEPLLSIASVIDAESGDESLRTFTQLVDLALDMAGERQEREQLNNAVPAITGIMKEFLNGAQEQFVPSKSFFERVQRDEALQSITSPKALSDFLANFGLHPLPTPRKKEGESKRGYLINRNWVEELKARYT